MLSFSDWCQSNVPEQVDVEQVIQRLIQQRIETPSWGYGDSGTRFHVFTQQGAAKNVYQRLEDAAQVHKVTGIAPSAALHIPWDYVEDWPALHRHAQEVGIELGAINPNLFQDDAYKLGSLTNPDAAVRQKAVGHMKECVDIMRELDSDLLSLWLPDGTNYPGQDDFRSRKRRLEESLEEVMDYMDPHMTLLIEYKFFEPAFYHTDLADWGSAVLLAHKLGPRAKALVDLGHHPLAANIEQIVAFLIDEDKLGGFHFNNRKYADDDLTVGSINPYELFLIYNELAAGEADGDLDIAYMIDQSHNIKPKVEAMVQSVLNIQETYAKALLVDRKTLRESQRQGDVVACEELLLKAYRTDVTPLLHRVREAMGIDPDPLQAYRKSEYPKYVLTRGT